MISWIAISKKSELIPGRLKSVYHKEHEFLLFRNKSGSVHLWNARCPHLGASLVDGKIKDGKLICPFHGWEFSVKDDSTHARCEKMTGIEANCYKIKIKNLEIFEANEFIYAREDELNTVISWQEKNKSPLQDNLNICGWYIIERSTRVTEERLTTIAFGKKIQLHRNEKNEVIGYYEDSQHSLYLSESDGNIFVWYHPQELAPTWNIHPSEIEPQWKLQKSIELPSTAAIMLMHENGVDVNHFPSVHYANIVPNSMKFEQKDYFFKYSILVNFFGLKIFVEEKHIGIGYSVIKTRWPGGSEILMSSSTIPVDSKRVISKQYFYAKKSSFIYKIIIAFMAWNIRKDLAIWAKQTYDKRHMIFKNENLLLVFRRWADQFVQN